jgi:uncharacterized membrane protein (DUF106 family)
MSLVNAVLVRLFDFLLTPFRSLPPLAGLAVVSLVTAVGMLLVLRRTSDQARLSAVKRSIHAGLFEIRLFNDDLRAVLRAQAEILRHNGTYLRLSIIPMLWMIGPLVLVIAQLQFHYGYAAIRPGQSVLVKAHLRSTGARSASTPIGSVAAGAGEAATTVASLEVPDSIQVETPAVWLSGAGEVVWRIAPEAEGEYRLRVHAGGESQSKTLVVTDSVARRSPLRPAASFLNEVLYPSEPPLPHESAFSAIAVGYAEGSVNVFGGEVHWMIVYFALSIVFAFALRKPFGVVL